MSIEVLQDNLCVNRLIEGKKKEITLESSIIVPDIKPDIVKPIDLSGNVCIYKKEIINGRVKIDGTIDSNIIYLVDSGDELIRGLNSNIDFSEFLEIDSNISQADIDANIVLKNMECDVLNGRKVNLKATIEINVRLYSNDGISILKDINGISSSYENTFEVEDKPNITLEQVDGKIKATIESKNNIDYVMYYWDEDEANAMKGTINNTKTEPMIDVLEGTHTLNIIAVDVNGNQTKKSQKIIGDNKPKIDVKTNGKVFRIIASDDEGLSKIEYTFNSQEMQTEEVSDKEYTKDLELQAGKNNLTVTVYNKNGLSETTTVEYVKE